MATMVDSDRTEETGPGSGSGSGRPGLGSRVTAVRSELESLLAELDPARLSGADATGLYAEFAASERLCVAGKTLLAPRIEASRVWKEGGHRDAAAMLGLLEGVPTGQARATLTNGRRLDELPATEEALRTGTLSAPKLTELCGAGALDPDRESELVEGAAKAPLESVKERCRRSRAASSARDPLAATRRIRAERHFTSWTDAEGAFCYKGRDTADRGATILDRLSHAATALHQQRMARAGDNASTGDAAPGDATTGDAASAPTAEAGGPISQRALWADAFFALVTRQGTGPVPSNGGAPVDQTIAGQSKAARPSPDALRVITRPPTCTTMVRVDIDALFRGEALPGELCEIDGQGPIPVPMARDLANDSFLAVLFHRAGDIRAVSHLGRTINAALRTALVYRDRICVVPGCGVSQGLEIDHVMPVAEGGPTELDNLALLCYDHHHLKTYEHWVLTRTGVDAEGRPTWTFDPQPDFGQEPGLGIDTDEGRAEWHRHRQRE